MLSIGRDELYCDLLETYGLLGWSGLSALELATLSFGLRENSRIKMKLSGTTVDTQTLLLASIVDNLALQTWFQSTDGAKGRNRPKSVVDSLLNPVVVEKNDIVAFDTIEEFESARRRILEME